LQLSKCSIPLDISRGIIPVSVNIIGRRSKEIIEMALDTGATYTLISTNTLIDVGYNPIHTKKKIDISTANGIVLAPLIVIKSLRCWGREVKNIDVVCHDLPRESPVQGLLGLNFLKHIDLHLLFKKKLLEVS